MHIHKVLGGLRWGGVGWVVSGGGAWREGDHYQDGPERSQ